uniref:heat shock 70 kDa protein II-like n=1 Tax=Styela clava TaxID=7725 RepID=UPI00193960A7|nr:heat shock 70 kDa protein II-like [Styela clava]
MSAIGIDLGTTNSCVGVYIKNQIKIIENFEGNRVTPSFVSFTEDERLVGDAAKLEAHFNVENSLFEIKRLIGRTYDDPIVQADMKLWGFTVINEDNRPKIPVISISRRKIFSPEEISAMVLESLKISAEVKLRKQVKDAVITVPAYFNDAQRSATRDAGIIAGLNVLRIINEPTAAAIAYGLDQENKEKQTVIVIDLGGGTFDVTIVNIEEGVFDVIATGGDTHLGGNDFDNVLVEHFVAEFNSMNKCDMSNDKVGVSRLRFACEYAKKLLSVKTIATIQVDGIFNGLHIRSKLSRAKFEDLNCNFFSQVMKTIKDTLSDANMTNDQINSVVLIGGSTRIPKIRKLIENFFGKEKINGSVNPDEAVAQGAAALAALICSEDLPPKFTLKDVAPLSIGWKNSKGAMVPVIKRNTKIPTEKWCKSRTAHDNQTKATMKLYEGERSAADDNHYLGTISIDVPSALKGVEEFRTCFSLDVSGILTVVDHSVSTGKSKYITVGNKSRLSAEEVAAMVERAEILKKEDTEWKSRCDKVHELEDFMYSVKHSFDDPRLKHVTEKNKAKVLEKCEEITKWIKFNKNPKVHESKDKQEELEETCRHIFHGSSGGYKLLQELRK